MPSPDACEQCVATLSRNEQKNARHDGAMARWRDGAMARWRDGAMARWRDGRILKQSIGPVPFHEKMDASLRQRPKPNILSFKPQYPRLE